MNAVLLLAGVVLASMVACDGSKTPAPANLNESATAPTVEKTHPWVPDPKLKTLISNVKLIRDDEGGAVLAAHVALPFGTKLLVEFGPEPLPKPGHPLNRSSGQWYNVTHEQTIKTDPFTDHGKVLRKGNYHYRFFCRFDAGWQTGAGILDLVGKDGANLSKAALKPQDPDLPRAAQDRWQLEEMGTVALREVSQDLLIIEKVKSARLTVPERGRSADPISGVVALYTKDPDIIPGRWTAAQQSDKTWIVSLAFQQGHFDHGKKDGMSNDVAQWSYIPNTGTVRYLDKHAKLFSWSPRN